MNAGELAFDVALPATGRERVALFSDATEDPNPIHVDDAFARRCGFAEVIQQGPMTTAHLAHLLAQRFGRERVRSLDLVFTAPVFPGDALRLTAVSAGEADGRLRLDLTAAKQDGTVTARGSAEIGDLA